jgi:hypothetical protein
VILDRETIVALASRVCAVAEAPAIIEAERVRILLWQWERG